MSAAAPVPHETWRMEQFGRAYVEAIASVVGCQVSKPAYDDDSIDLTFSAKTTSGPLLSPRLDAQLKTTFQDVLYDDDVRYPLKIKNYDELRRENYAVPRILVVVIVPPGVDQWTQQSEGELALRRCGYWVSLRGHPPTSNTTTETVSIPRANIFDVPALRSIFDRLKDGGLP